MKVTILTYTKNIWPLPCKCVKINFPSQTQKLHCSNKNCFDDNDCNETSVFSWTYRDPARTNDTLESVHFLWWYSNETIKTLYYVSEFKSSKDIRHQKPVLGLCLLYQILAISMLRYWLMVLPCARILCMITRVQGHNFWRENPCDSPKNWTLWSFLSLSSLWNILF